MFDDQPISSNTPSAPNNLPLGEPQDIFEGTESPEIAPLPTPAVNPVSAPPAPLAQPTALNAGILKPKSSTDAPSYTTPPVMGAENAIKEPKLSRGIMMTIMVLVIGFVLIGTGWFVYSIFMKKPIPAVVTPLEPISDTVNPTVVKPDTQPVTPSVDVTPTTSSDAVDKEIINGESPDSDGDGLKDEREKELGTDPNNWDTDKDDLSDGEEILIWHTNPKNSDTDGDTYLDGAEVKAGYNPSGPGRLAEIMSATSTSFASNTTPSNNSGSSTVTTTSASTSTPASTSSFQIEL